MSGGVDFTSSRISCARKTAGQAAAERGPVVYLIQQGWLFSTVQSSILVGSLHKFMLLSAEILCLSFLDSLLH
jgi:hypothetical protein